MSGVDFDVKYILQCIIAC